MKYIFDKNYFKIIDSIDKAYFLGLIMGDGSNIGGGLIINLQSEDAYILEKFKDCIQYTGNIKKFTPKGCKNGCKEIAKIGIYSTELSKDLKNLGVVQRKHYATKFPDIDKSLYSHFIRGLFDADGCISRNDRGKFIFNIVGYYDLIKCVQDILIKECKLSATTLTPDNRTKGNTVTVHYSGNIQVKRIRDYLYKDSDTLFLTRKHEKFSSITTNKDRLKKIHNRCCKICGEIQYMNELCKKHYNQHRYLKQKVKKT